MINQTNIESVRLVIREAATVLGNYAQRDHEQSAETDWKTKTASLLAADHVKKLAWVVSLLEVDGHTSPSRDKSELSQDLLRHLKGRMSFWQVESMREGLSCLRRGLTDAEFHELCDDLARDLEHYGNI